MPNALDATPLELQQMRAAGIHISPENLAKFRAALSKNAPVSKIETGKQKPANRPYAPYRSKWEHQYARYLELSVIMGISWAYEPDRLVIGVGAVYTPDFRVTCPNGQIEYHEVKGYRREAAIVRIKAAALRYPQFKFVIVTRVRGEWRHTTIGAKR